MAHRDATADLGHDGPSPIDHTGVMEARARVDALATALAAAGDAERAASMAAYMKHRFVFFGVQSAPRRAVQREVLGRWRSEPGELVTFALDCWDRDEREMQYAACDLLRRHADRLTGHDLPTVEYLIVSKPWWDTVDTLAAHVVGPLVAADPSLEADLDRWLGSGDLWLERAAILHQLAYGEQTDEVRLFRACLSHAASTEFFHRKAIGWALRQYARVAPDAVRSFVAVHEAELSGLSKREATKHLG
jgi:3-methyladenine DNA glycosylase AlkD